MKKSWYVLGLLLGMGILAILQMPDGRTRIIACDVGQGDAILIIKGSNQVLIDGGSSGERALSCLSRHLPYWDRKIELIVLTNTDFDHMNGLSSVVERYQVMQFVTADGAHESQALARMREALAEAEVLVVAVEQGDMMIVGSGEAGEQLVMEVLWPPQVEEQYVAVLGDQLSEDERKQILGESAKRGDLNERSVVLMLSELGYRALLMADSGFQTEKELLKSGVLPQIDYLKVGHHGSKYASGLEFLQTTTPSIAVISVGKNRYGHPTKETLGRLEEVGAKIKRTDEEGDVVIELENGR